MPSGPDLIEPQWPAPPGVRAAFTLRTGGVSAAPYDSFNCASHVGDEEAAVRENRRRLRERLALPGAPVWLEQVHGTGVAVLGGSPEPLAPADAAVTRTAGCVCAVQVADCLPVLLASRDGAVIGAAHAGWRGLVAGVLEAAVHALGADPGDVLAWVGPAIGPAHFEVGTEVREAFLRRDCAAAAAFTPNARGRWQCDLPALAHQRLAALGVRQIYGGSWCTYADSAKFFSYRRDGRCGRMAALIWRS
ncbi:MAG: peptidoglycan editing factor PgeF [Steroidobacteraceae bacterium]